MIAQLLPAQLLPIWRVHSRTTLRQRVPHETHRDCQGSPAFPVTYALRVARPVLFNTSSAEQLVINKIRMVNIAVAVIEANGQTRPLLRCADKTGMASTCASHGVLFGPRSCSGEYHSHKSPA